MVGLLVVVALIAGACAAGATPLASIAPTAASGAAAPIATTAAAKTPVVLPPAEFTDKITIGLSNNVATNQYINILAKDLGLFQRYGLNVDVISMSSGAGAVVQGLVANALQAGEVSPGYAMAAATTDAPLVMTTVDSSSLAYTLLGAKDIKTAADLKGKAIAIGTYGDVSHAAVLAALSQLGLKASDVTLQVVGNEAARITTVVAGAVAAAPVQTVNAAKVVAQGANALVDLTKSPIKFVLAGLTFTKAFATKNPNTVLRLIAAQLEAQKLMWTKESLAITAYMASTQLDQATSKSSMDVCVAGYCNKGLRFTKDDLALNRDLQATLTPAVATMDLTSVYDLSYLDKLQQLGFNAEIAFP